MRKNVKKHTGEKRPEKRPRKGRKTKTKRGKIPMVVGDHGNLGCRISAERAIFFDAFHLSRIPAPVSFPKYDFSNIKSVDLHRYLGSTIKSTRSSSHTSKSPTGQLRQYTFYSTDQEIDWIDVTSPLVSIND